MPDLRRVAGRAECLGRGWIGLTTREAYLTTDVTVTPLVSAWLFLLIAAGLDAGRVVAGRPELNLSAGASGSDAPATGSLPEMREGFATVTEAGAIRTRCRDMNR
jgi:hypothetical protein